MTDIPLLSGCALDGWPLTINDATYNHDRGEVGPARACIQAASHLIGRRRWVWTGSAGPLRIAITDPQIVRQFDLLSEQYTEGVTLLVLYSTQTPCVRLRVRLNMEGIGAQIAEGAPTTGPLPNEFLELQIDFSVSTNDEDDARTVHGELRFEALKADEAEEGSFACVWSWCFIPSNALQLSGDFE